MFFYQLGKPQKSIVLVLWMFFFSHGLDEFEIFFAALTLCSQKRMKLNIYSMMLKPNFYGR